jgi:SAM-dependent methyltransferase
MDWFKQWFGSPYYKILYQNRDEFEAQEFIEHLLAYLRPPQGSTMLDIACGGGRFAKQLAEHGFDVTGIDISVESIECARKHENSHLHFFTQDMRMPFYINYFDYAFNFFTSFGYFSHARDHATAARSFAASLKPGGILVIDYLNFEYVLANLVAQETIERGNLSFHISRKLERKHIVKDICFKGEDNFDYHFRESVAAFSLADFIDMFKPGGMSLVATFGDYKLGPYHPSDAPRMIMIFKKKHA